MAPQTFRLVMRTGPNPGKVYDLSQSELLIGRDISNDIVINDAEVSRRHARLIVQGGGYVLEDTGSTNGTFVNGQRLMGPHLLRPGELILFGENVSLTYEAMQFDPDATMVASAGIPAARQPEPQVPPPPAQSYPPPPRPAPAPAYSGQVPPGPAEAYPYPEDMEERRSSRTWLFAGLGCLLVVLCVLLAGAWLFDYLNLYCSSPLSGFFQCP